MPCSASAGRIVFVPAAVLLLDQLAGPLRDALQLRERVEPVGASRPAARTPPNACSRRPATRTMKNSSRFELKIDRNFTRSSSGLDGVLGFFQHAGVELQPAQLAVDEVLGLVMAAVRAWRAAAKSGSGAVCVRAASTIIAYRAEPLPKRLRCRGASDSRPASRRDARAQTSASKTRTCAQFADCSAMNCLCRGAA